jgi:DNA/RNA endonuclease G (NUC1)
MMIRFIFFSLLCQRLSLARVVGTSFANECSQFFLRDTPPTGLSGTAICQTYGNRLQYATMYSTADRIPIYSAYISSLGSTGRQDNTWKVEPQLTDSEEDGNMAVAGNDNIYRNAQAVNSDYRLSNYDRGHLNPDLHNRNENKAATYTLTNAAPMKPEFNRDIWKQLESMTSSVLKGFCSDICTAYHITGVIVDRRSPVRINNRVSVPRFVWSVVCLVFRQSDRLVYLGFGFRGEQNLNDNDRMLPITLGSIEEIEDFLSLQYGSRVETFQDCKNDEPAENDDLLHSLMIEVQHIPEKINQKLGRTQPCSGGNVILNNHAKMDNFYNNIQRDLISYRPDEERSVIQNLQNVGIGCNQLQLTPSWVHSRRKRSVEEFHCIPQRMQSLSISAGNSLCLDGTCKKSKWIGIYECQVLRSFFSSTDRCCASECFDKGTYFFCWNSESQHFWSHWSYCSPPYSAITINNVPCRSGHVCGLHGEDYYWCYTDESGVWDYCCAPYSECDSSGYCHIGHWSHDSYLQRPCGKSSHRDELMVHSVETFCDPGFAPFCENKNCYCFKFFNDRKSWIDAENHCKTFHGGHLAAIHSKELMAFLHHMVTETPLKAWIGLFKSEDEKFNWTDGSKIEEAFWAPLEPRNNCGQMYAYNRPTEIKWATLECSQTSTYFCQVNRTISRRQGIYLKTLLLILWFLL